MKIIYEFADGRVAVVSLPPEATKVALVADDAVPTDRSQRQAWVHAGDRVAIDPAKVKPA